MMPQMIRKKLKGSAFITDEFQLHEGREKRDVGK